jgi:hydroxymethylbilane synthase
MLAHANAECLHTPSKVKEIVTRGDTSNAESLRALGPGAFTEAIDEAVAAGEVDIGVHSLKDSPLLLPEGVTLRCCLPREDPRDALISKGGMTLGEVLVRHAIACLLS